MTSSGDGRQIEAGSRVGPEFEAAITCKHGIFANYCDYGCRRPDWRGCIVRSENGTYRTIGMVADEFVADGRIASIEVVEQYFARSANGIERRVRRRNYRKLALIASVTIIGGKVVYEGGRWLLRVWAERQKKERLRKQ